MGVQLDTRIPICLVTGFLGSGKTTFLKRLVSQHADRKLFYLVNEFSPQDIDGAIVSENNPNVVSIPGGSIFCRCLAGQFINQFTTIPERMPDVEGIVIEASGMANPTVIADMLREARLDDRYVLAHIVSIVDPASFLKLRITLPNIVAQVEAADTVLINKIDCASAPRVAETADAVSQINPEAIVHEVSYSRADMDLFTPVAADRDLHGEFALCRDPNYQAVTLRPSNSISINDLRDRVLAAEADLYRAKGYVRAGGATVYFDYSKSGFTSREEPQPRDPAAVLIMRSEPSDAARALVDWLGGQSA